MKTETLDRIAVCPLKGRVDSFTQLEWNHICFMHLIWVREHGGCECDD